MSISVFHVNAFSARVFGGNPAAVCPLDKWLPDATLQAIAAEHNLSETAFVVREPDGAYRLRWFTPAVEVDLCGHATLASALVVFQELEPGRATVDFHTRSGKLTVARRGDRLSMDFPSRPGETCAPTNDLLAGLGKPPQEVYRSRDYLAVYASEAEVGALAPDMRALARVNSLGVIVTAPGDGCDFVSRFFAPQSGIDEDPVTGSAHCTLVPYWSARLGKQKLHALQVSRRGGELWCEQRGQRVEITGNAVLYSRGTILL